VGGHEQSTDQEEECDRDAKENGSGFPHGQSLSLRCSNENRKRNSMDPSQKVPSPRCQDCQMEGGVRSSNISPWLVPTKFGATSVPGSAPFAQAFCLPNKSLLWQCDK
jgi:hypothetical protein